MRGQSKDGGEAQARGSQRRELPSVVMDLLVEAADRRRAQDARHAIRTVTVSRLRTLNGFARSEAESARDAATRFLGSLTNVAAVLSCAYEPEEVEDVHVGDQVDEQPVQVALCELMRLRLHPLKPALPMSASDTFVHVFEQLVDAGIQLTPFLRRLRAKLEADERRELEPVDTEDFQPARFFPKRMRSRLRKAKQGGRIATTGQGRSIRYSVSQARRLWPDEEIGG